MLRLSWEFPSFQLHICITTQNGCWSTSLHVSVTQGGDRGAKEDFLRSLPQQPQPVSQWPAHQQGSGKTCHWEGSRLLLLKVEGIIFIFRRGNRRVSVTICHHGYWLPFLPPCFHLPFLLPSLSLLIPLLPFSSFSPSLSPFLLYLAFSFLLPPSLLLPSLPLLFFLLPTFNLWLRW